MYKAHHWALYHMWSQNKSELYNNNIVIFTYRNSCPREYCHWAKWDSPGSHSRMFALCRAGTFLQYSPHKTWCHYCSMCQAHMILQQILKYRIKNMILSLMHCAVEHIIDFQSLKLSGTKISLVHCSIFICTVNGINQQIFPVLI